MKYRRLRIAFSAMCGVLCLLLIALWVRSWTWQDDCGYAFADTRELRFISVNGLVDFHCGYDPFAETPVGEWFVYSDRIDDIYLEGEVPTTQWKLKLFEDEVIGRIPHWFPILMFALAGILPWLAWLPWRFSLRTLLIAMTLVAILLGLIVYAAS
jgi:hypothetical protein